MISFWHIWFAALYLHFACTLQHFLLAGQYPLPGQSSQHLLSQAFLVSPFGQSAMAYRVPPPPPAPHTADVCRLCFGLLEARDAVCCPASAEHCFHGWCYDEAYRHLDLHLSYIFSYYFIIIFMKQITCRLQHDYNTITAYLMHIYIILHYIYIYLQNNYKIFTACYHMISYVYHMLSDCYQHVHIMFTSCSQFVHSMISNVIQSNVIPGDSRSVFKSEQSLKKARQLLAGIFMQFPFKEDFFLLGFF